MKPATNSTNTTRLPSPAKLNLMLHIVGRRPNGYHELQSIFQLLDYGDEIEVEIIDSPELSLNTLFDQVAEDQNLIIKAARLLQSETNCKKGAVFTVNKRLPMGGGLGGGSSNAASVLVGLNALWQTGLSLEALATLGLQLGADVPIFVMGQSSWAEGVGEKLTPVKLPELWYLVIFPNCHVDTGQIFSHPDLTRNTPIMTIRNALTHGGHNDCEPVVRKLNPQVDDALNWLNEYANARLTGTGSCIFASFQYREQAEETLAKLPSKFQGFVAQAINHSTLHSSLGN